MAGVIIRGVDQGNADQFCEGAGDGLRKPQPWFTLNGYGLP
jgi:hypothetical protein